MLRVSRQNVIRQGGGKSAYFDMQNPQFMIKCISVPLDDSSHQNIVTNNVSVETNSDYQSKQL